MRCFICNSELQENSIQWNNDHQDWDPCPTCLIEIAEVFTDDSEEEITAQLEGEWSLIFGEADTAEEEVEHIE